jgi:hypothetical protein
VQRGNRERHLSIETHERVPETTRLLRRAQPVQTPSSKGSYPLRRPSGSGGPRRDDSLRNSR